MNLFNDSRAQAALVDSLFFIAIVSAICTGLFYFAINYGLSTESSLNSFYSSDFAMDSLKVITYVNVMRDGSAVSINPSTPVSASEYDYLLASIKEDFAQKKEIGMESRKAIANTLYSVLKPFDDSIDYVFYVIKEGATVQEAKYIALIIAVHVPSDSGTEGQYYCDPLTKKCSYINRVFYSCNPTEKSVLEKCIFPNVGKVDSAIGKITLSDSPYTIGLHTWVSKRIDALKNLDPNNSDPNSPNPDSSNCASSIFSCTKIEGVPPNQ